MSNTCTGSWIPAPVGSPFTNEYRHKLVPLIAERMKLGPAPSAKYGRGTQGFGGRMPMSALRADGDEGLVEYVGIIVGGRLAIVGASRLPN
jgi:hypothetical protein